MGEPIQMPIMALSKEAFGEFDENPESFMKILSERLREIFQKDGKIIPTSFFINQKSVFILVAPFYDEIDKDTFSQACRNFAQECEAYGYAFVSEVWVSNVVDGSENYISPSKDPLREEAVILSCEWRGKKTCLGSIAIIHNDEKEEVDLGKLELLPFEKAEGRFVGVLPFDVSCN